jgi:hypothetical protein
MNQENLVDYKCSIRRAEKNLCFYEVTFTIDGVETTRAGQSFGVGDAMKKMDDMVHEALVNSGKVR